MKTSIIEKTKNHKPVYPRLMISRGSGAVVLQTKEFDGTVVHETELSVKVGTRIDFISADVFEQFHGSVTISTDN
jgi:hypothetical protein